MKKRAQLLGLPLIYIFALVVGALILVWGISTIFKLAGYSDEILLGTAVSDIKEQINIYSNYDPGTLYSFTNDFRIPKDIKYVCFTNPNSPPDLTIEEMELIDSSLPILVETSQENLHIFPQGDYSLTSYKIPHLRSTKTPLCIKTQLTNKGKLPFTIEVKSSQDKLYVEVIR